MQIFNILLVAIAAIGASAAPAPGSKAPTPPPPAKQAPPPPPQHQTPPPPTIVQQVICQNGFQESCCDNTKALISANCNNIQVQVLSSGTQTNYGQCSGSQIVACCNVISGECTGSGE